MSTGHRRPVRARLFSFALSALPGLVRAGRLDLTQYPLLGVGSVWRRPMYLFVAEATARLPRRENPTWTIKVLDGRGSGRCGPRSTALRLVAIQEGIGNDQQDRSHGWGDRQHPPTSAYGDRADGNNGVSATVPQRHRRACLLRTSIVHRFGRQRGSAPTRRPIMRIRGHRSSRSAASSCPVPEELGHHQWDCLRVRKIRPSYLPDRRSTPTPYMPFRRPTPNPWAALPTGAGYWPL